MFLFRSLPSHALRLVTALGIVACASQSACQDDSTCERKPDSEICSDLHYASYKTDLKVSCPILGLDSRQDSTIGVVVSVLDTNKKPVDLAPPGSGVPRVYLLVDQTRKEVTPEDITLGADQNSLIVKLRSNQLPIGRAAVQVEIANTLTLQAKIDLSCASVRSPLLGAATELMLVPHAQYSTGFTGVQIGTVLGSTQRLFLGVEFQGATALRRWAELYGVSNGTIGQDTTNSTWVNTVQSQLQESASALFAVTRDALLIYDVYLGSTAKNLSLFSLNPASSTRTANLTSMVPSILINRTSMAAASDDQLMLLGGPGAVAGSGTVRVFRVAPMASPPIIPLADEIGVTGNPVLAARAERTGTPKVAYGPYFGVAWGSDGKATLLQASAVTMAVSATALDDTAQAGFATSLGSAQVVAAALGELNGDGLEDLLVAASDGRLLWAPQQLDSRFGKARELNVKSPGGVTALAIGELNNDGLTDLALIADAKAYVYFGQP